MKELEINIGLYEMLGLPRPKSYEGCWKVILDPAEWNQYTFVVTVINHSKFGPLTIGFNSVQGIYDLCLEMMLDSKLKAMSGTVTDLPVIEVYYK